MSRPGADGAAEKPVASGLHSIPAMKRPPRAECAPACPEAARCAARPSPVENLEVHAGIARALAARLSRRRFAQPALPGSGALGLPLTLLARRGSRGAGPVRVRLAIGQMPGRVRSAACDRRRPRAGLLRGGYDRRNGLPARERCPHRLAQTMIRDRSLSRDGARTTASAPDSLGGSLCAAVAARCAASRRGMWSHHVDGADEWAAAARHSSSIWAGADVRSISSFSAAYLLRADSAVSAAT